MQVLEKHGMALVYDTDDVADVEIALPHDVNSQVVDGTSHHELGTAHLRLDITFQPGKSAAWVRMPPEPAVKPHAANPSQGGQ